MSALAELAKRLAESAAAKDALERVGAAFNRGAAQPGTFQRGRAFADTPEGLARQFDWGAPEPFGANGLRLRAPDGSGSDAYVDVLDRPSVVKFAHDEGAVGASPFIFQSDLPTSLSKFHVYDTGPLGGDGAGKRAYPALYGNTLLDPSAVNIKGTLSGPNTYRNNYNLASAIMRQPNAGERLLASPEQFRNLGLDVANLRTAGPDAQVGGLQTEGALETLRRLLAGEREHPRLSPLYDLLLKGGLSSPAVAEQAARAIRANSNAFALKPVGPGALRRLGITREVLEGRDPSPGAFRGLEFRRGGLVQAAECGCL